MHRPHHIVALATAAQFIIEKMDHAMVLPDQIPGYLVVSNVSLQELLVLHVGTFCHLSGSQLATLASERNRALVRLHETEALVDGVTSGHGSVHMAGSVAASQLAIGYASRDGHSNPQADEAVAIMIAIRAGLLSKHSLRKRYCNRHLSEHNPHLRQLIDAITWTS